MNSELANLAVVLKSLTQSESVDEIFESIKNALTGLQDFDANNVLVEFLQALDNLLSQHSADVLGADSNLRLLLSESGDLLEQVRDTDKSVDFESDTSKWMEVIEQIDLYASGVNSLASPEQEEEVPETAGEAADSTTANYPLFRLRALNRSLSLAVSEKSHSFPWESTIEHQQELLKQMWTTTYQTHTNQRSVSEQIEKLRDTFGGGVNLGADSGVHESLLLELGHLVQLVSNLLSSMQDVPKPNVSIQDEYLLIQYSIASVREEDASFIDQLAQLSNRDGLLTLNDHEITEYFLQHVAKEGQEKLIQDVVDGLHRLRASVHFNAQQTNLDWSIRIPKSLAIEQVTTFELGSSQYAIESQSVLDVVKSPQQDRNSFEPAVLYKNISYSIAQLGHLTASYNPTDTYLILRDAHIALPVSNGVKTDYAFMDINEQSGHFPHGCLELKSGNLAILIDTQDLLQTPDSIARQPEPANKQLRVLLSGVKEERNWFDSHVFDTRDAHAPSDLRRELQEQTPHLVATTVKSASSTLRILRQGFHPNLPVLVLPSSDKQAYQIEFDDSVYRVASREELKKTLVQIGLLESKSSTLP